ncbi:sulfotransferase family 2 domain-containing protein [Pseudoxanthobacter sp. M-2]|uniref:hypothetical protein n=1 Tax=Pseudoxanthobacter sp. M-2 TaxID=3078754 RepID=UPI0038FC0A65
MPPQPGRRIVFLHLFKCGGTTVIERLRSRLGASAVLHVKDVHAFDASLRENPAALADRKAVVGHLSLPLLETHFADWAWVTVLRDPVDRMLSQYHHFRREAGAFGAMGDEAGDDHGFRVRFCAENDLLAFATSEDPRLTVYTRNYMTRKLAGVTRRRRSQLGEKARATAIANLPRFAAVGTTDTLDETFLPALDDMMGRRPNLVDRLRPRANVSAARQGRRPPLDDAALDAILAHNAADIALYAAARWFDATRRQPASLPSSVDPHQGERP